jgi:hypothetical protein
MVWSPLKFIEDTYLNTFENLYLKFYWEFEVEPIVKLFNILNSSIMQGLSSFGATENIHSVFPCSEEFEIDLEKFKPTGAHMPAARCLSTGAPGTRFRPCPPNCRSPLAAVSVRPPPPHQPPRSPSAALIYSATCQAAAKGVTGAGHPRLPSSSGVAAKLFA